MHTPNLTPSEQMRLDLARDDLAVARAGALAVLAAQPSLDHGKVALEFAYAVCRDVEISDDHQRTEVSEAVVELLPSFGSWAPQVLVSTWTVPGDRTQLVEQFPITAANQAAEAWRDVVRAVHRSFEKGAA